MGGNEDLRDQRRELGEHVELREASDSLTESVGVVEDHVRLREIDQRVRNGHEHDETADTEQVRRLCDGSRTVPETPAHAALTARLLRLLPVLRELGMRRAQSDAIE